MEYCDNNNKMKSNKDAIPIGISKNNEIIEKTQEKYKYLFNVPENVTMPKEAYLFNPSRKK